MGLSEANRHVMAVYLQPLRVYFMGSSFSWLGEPDELVAFFTGQGPHERDYKRGATIKFDKGTEPKYIELRIKDSAGKLQPEFDVKVWQ